MANSIAKLAILLTADATGVKKGFAQAEQSVQSLTSTVSSIAASIAALVGGASAISWGVQLAAEAETAKVGFEVMLGSAEKAAKMFKEIKQFAAETPFESAELVKSARSLKSTAKPACRGDCSKRTSTSFKGEAFRLSLPWLSTSVLPRLPFVG